MEKLNIRLLSFVRQRLYELFEYEIESIELQAEKVTGVTRDDLNSYLEFLRKLSAGVKNPDSDFSLECTLR